MRFAFPALVMCAVAATIFTSSAASAGPAPMGTVIAASGIGAVATDDGVATVAHVRLQSSCYQARIEPLRMKWAYRVVSRRIPGTEHKICAMVIVPVALGFFERGTAMSIRVTTASGTASYPVSSPGAWTPAT
jgi:hypothetical protein